MNLTVRIPDEMAVRLAARGGDLERRALEALLLEAFRAGRVTRAELGQTLGFTAAGELDGFLKAHGVSEKDADDKRTRATAALLARIRAFRTGKTLGGIDPAALIRKGRR